MNARVKSLSFERKVGAMGSARLELSLENDASLDPLLTVPDAQPGKLLQINAGYKQVTGASPQGGPAPRAAFVGIIDTYQQRNKPDARDVTVSVSSVFKDLHRTPPQELLYANITRQSLMEQIIESEGHVAPQYHEFSDVGAHTYTSVTSRGASVAEVLRQIAEAGESLLLETQDGRIVARPFPEQRDVDYILEDSDYEVEHVESDIDFVNVIKVYGRKLLESEVSGESRVVYNRVHSYLIPRYLVPTPTVALVAAFDIAPIDTSSGVRVELFWTSPADPTYYADVWRLEPDRAFIRVWRTDDTMSWSGEVTFQVRITGTPTLEAWEQELRANQSSDQTRIFDRVVNEAGVRQLRQIIENAVTNEFIDSEAQAESVALHVLAVNQSRRHKFVLRGPYDPRIDVGHVLVVPYEGRQWRCWVDGLTAQYDAGDAGLMSQLTCGYLGEYKEAS